MSTLPNISVHSFDAFSFVPNCPKMNFWRTSGLPGAITYELLIKLLMGVKPHTPLNSISLLNYQALWLLIQYQLLLEMLASVTDQTSVLFHGAPLRQVNHRLPNFFNIILPEV